MEQRKIQSGLSFFQRQYHEHFISKTAMPTRPHRRGLHVGQRIGPSVRGILEGLRPHSER